MINTNPTAGIIPTTGSSSSSSSTAGGMSGALTGGTTLGKDDFLKLLVGQLQHQDPMQPSDDSQFIGQMAQFSQLEQETNVAQTTTKISGSLDRSGALSLIGHTVTYADAQGNTSTGVVDQVDMDKDGNASLTVGGKSGIGAATVTEVK